MLDKKIVSILSALTLTLSISVYADSQPQDLAPGTQLIKSLTNNKAQVKQSFKTDIGLEGHVIAPVEQGGQEQVVFTKGDDYLVIGNVITKGGENLTELYTQKLITSKVAKASYQAISKLNWIAEGSDDAKHKLYVIFDPNCIYCHLFYKEINKLDLIKDKELQVRWLPVGFLKPSSAGMAAAMFSAKSPVQAIVQDESGFNTTKEQGGLNPLDKSSKNPKVVKAFDKVTANTQFFAKYGFGGTPTLIYKDNNGKYAYIPGFVKGAQLKSLVNSLSTSW